MGGVTRTCMDWIDRLWKFHKLKGRNVEKYPQLAGKTLNYYHLHSIVKSLGGFQVVSNDQRWFHVFSRLGFPQFQTEMPILQQIYILYREIVMPFDHYIYMAKALDELKKVKTPLSSPKLEESCTPVEQIMDNQGNLLSSVASVSSVGSRSYMNSPHQGESDRVKHESPPVSHIRQLPQTSQSPELTTFVSRSPSPESESYEKQSSESPIARTRGVRSRPSRKRVLESEEEEEVEEGTTQSNWSLLPSVKIRRSSRMRLAVKEDDEEEEDKENSENEDNSENEIFTCEFCDGQCDARSYITCKDCENAYHYSCLDRCFLGVDTDWYCPRCLSVSGEFGFDKGNVYNLSDFQDVADDFREDYLLRQGVENEDNDDTELFVEKQFWKHIEDPNTEVQVEYGADIHCNEHGSGFPSLAKEPFNRYAKDLWNLNNLPLHKNSLFHNIKSDISGMTVPWVYVGMMFSTFCWHSEDHYTYSVNYQHFGDTKTWYGVPGADAHKFEAAMKRTIPELFEHQPDILFQLVTMISPDILLRNNVRCYAIDQRAGQFVITFPQAYHAGFNHGFNFNEAVNFAPPDWVSYGRESVQTYKNFSRAPVFSHDSLLLRTAQEDRRQQTAKWLYDHLKLMYQEELETRRDINARFPTISHELIESDLPEEEYQCAVCSSLPYLSRVVVIHKTDDEDDDEYDGKSYCPQHIPTIEDPGRLLLRTRISLHDLKMLCRDVVNRINND